MIINSPMTCLTMNRLHRRSIMVGRETSIPTKKAKISEDFKSVLNNILIKTTQQYILYFICCVQTCSFNCTNCKEINHFELIIQWNIKSSTYNINENFSVLIVVDPLTTTQLWLSYFLTSDHQTLQSIQGQTCKIMTYGRPLLRMSFAYPNASIYTVTAKFNLSSLEPKTSRM